jgi:glucose/arabinose dehydrogenase
LLIVALGAISALAALAPARADALPTGFYERTVLDGLNLPTAVRLAPDGRVFVAEKDGVLEVFDGFDDTTPEVFADLRMEVNSFGDRGLTGLALDPDFATNGYLYVAYTYDAPIGVTAPTHAGPGPAYDDFCVDQCEVSARVVRLDRNGGSLHQHVVLKDNWCQQWSGHSIGALEFDPQGRLYVSSGEGASFNQADYGQELAISPAPSRPPNPCGDPPGPENSALSPPNAEGGALRSQDLRTVSDPVGLSGTIARIDPATGEGVAANPLSSSPDPNARRILAYGFRNPFRFVISPAGDVWVADVGWRTWEELDAFSNSAASALNFGWPCYEGTPVNHDYDILDLDLCEDLYLQPGAVTAPAFAYTHHDPLYPGDPCPVPGGGSSLAGIELYNGASFPQSYAGALFFTDYARPCIWVIKPGTDGKPDPATIQAFDLDVVSPVDLEVGPDGALYYVDVGLGEIRRIQYSAGNRPPTAAATAAPTDGPLPLHVDFDARASSDLDPGDLLGYEWDLDGDGAYDDSTAATPTFTYTNPATVFAHLRVTDDGGLTDTDAIRIDAGNTRPVVTITGPAAGATWATGQPLHFTGIADDVDETLGAADMRWTVELNHCVTGGGCHVHPLETVTGVDDFELTAPDHYYPAHLTVTLIATDSNGLASTPRQLILNPRTVELGLQSEPVGMSLDVNGSFGIAPFSVTAIEGSGASVAAPSPQLAGDQSYEWRSWSDGGDRVHSFKADTSRTLTATFTTGGPGGGDPAPPPPPPADPVSVDVVKVRQPERARGIADRGVKALVRCSAACDVALTLMAEGRAARDAGFSGKVGGGRARLNAGAADWVHARLGEHSRHRLLSMPKKRVPWIVPRFEAFAR